MIPSAEPPAAAVDEVLITSELTVRPSRAPDYAAENAALTELAEAMAGSPQAVLQRLSEIALRLCDAGSAGVSLLDAQLRPPAFRWSAVAGKYAPNLNGTLPRDFSPCGTVLDRGRALLMAKPERFFPYIAALNAPVREVLLVPFAQDGVTIGTIWIVAHDDDRRFDAEDERIVTRLTKFASAAVVALRRIETAERAEATQREQEANFRALSMTTFDVVYRMNADWTEMQALEGRGILADTPEPDPDWLAKKIPAAEHARVSAAIREAIAAKRMFQLEHQIIRADGSQGWAFSRAIPLLDDAGSVREWFGAAGDISRRKQAEAELTRVTAESERSRRLYEALLSSTPDFVYVFSLDYRILYANESLIKMWGSSPLETVGKTFVELGYPQWHAEMHCREIDQVRATKTPIRGEVPFHGTDGRRIYEYIFVPVLTDDGEVEAVAGTTRDVTDRKGMEDELRETDRKKDDFIALLAHELRNPLAPIRNGLQVQRLAGGDPEASATARSIMERQLGHMVRLIDDLLDISRIGRNKMELRRGKILLADVVESAVEAVRPLVDEAGHTLRIDLPPEPLTLDGDLTRLAQVFGNLLSNSVKYTPPGGTIDLRAEHRDGEVVVTVRDNGIGIPAEFLPRIFDMFSQVDRSIERTTGGLGIGLALVQGLVEMHGGTVTADSGGPDRGSVFTVRLPIIEQKSNIDSVAPTVGGRQKRRLLVVDDNRDGAVSLAMMLRLLGDDVATAHDGVEAIAAAETFKPEVILMDVGMPRMNGLDAARHIKRQPWGRTINIIALTGWGQDNDRLRSAEAGCNGHLVKPVDIDELQKMLATM